MTALVILAAGSGTRLGELGRRVRKPLLPVGPRTLLEHHLATFAALGVTEAVVVVDAPDSPVVAAAREAAACLGVQVAVAVQERRGGVGHAVLAAEPVLGPRPFVLVLGDTFFLPLDLTRGLAPLERREADVVLSVRRVDDPERIRRECTIALQPDGRVARIVEKPREVLGPWKPCGIYFCGEALWTSLHATPASPLRNEIELTDAIQGVIAAGGVVRAAETLVDDVNVTTPRDVLEANLLWLAATGACRYVHAGATVAADARLEQAVVLAGARVEPGAELRRVVVFPGARIAAGERLSDVLVDPQLGPIA